MSRGKNLPAPMPKVDLFAKNWFIIKTRFLRVPLGPLSTWQLNMGQCVLPVDCFNFEGVGLCFLRFSGDSLTVKP